MKINNRKISKIGKHLKEKGKGLMGLDLVALEWNESGIETEVMQCDLLYINWPKLCQFDVIYVCISFMISLFSPCWFEKLHLLRLWHAMHFFQRLIWLLSCCIVVCFRHYSDIQIMIIIGWKIEVRFKAWNWL